MIRIWARYLWIIMIMMVLLQACIGDDFIDDGVEPQIRLTNLVDTLGIGEKDTVIALFFNNVGMTEDLPILWSSSNSDVAFIDESGVVTALNVGQTIISASLNYQSELVQSERPLVVSESTIENMITSRKGKLRTTSTYILEGSFDLSIEDGGLKLILSDDYKADDILPGLYVYLTNNPNSIVDAYNIGAVAVFEGAHSYDIGDEVDINDYSHVLYYCKPFSVKVGDGAFEE